MSAWFGDPWPSAATPAPVCEEPASRVPTPVGAPCLHCAEEVVEGDRGVLMPAVLMGEDGRLVTKIEPVHAECMVRMSTGGPAHLLGRCGCHRLGDRDAACEPDMGMTPRAAARWVWDYLYAHGEIRP